MFLYVWASETSGVGCGYSQGLREPPQVICWPREIFDFSPCIEKCKLFFFDFCLTVWLFLIVWARFH